MVAATMAICILSFMVWLHHFFTMGAGADVNAIFGIATMIIAVPTGVKIYNWLFTMYGGRVVFATPMLWALGFIVTFVIGGMTGVLLAVPPADFVLHNSLFLVAHFHNVIIGGVRVRRLRRLRVLVSEGVRLPPARGLGKAAFWFWIVGFYVAFMPLYVLGLMGMTRRMQHYDVPEWQPWLLVAAGRRGADRHRHRAARSCSWSGASATARRCATRPATRGTAARSNGRRPRRRRCSTSR